MDIESAEDMPSTALQTLLHSENTAHPEQIQDIQDCDWTDIEIEVNSPTHDEMDLDGESTNDFDIMDVEYTPSLMEIVMINDMEM